MIFNCFLFFFNIVYQNRIAEACQRQKAEMLPIYGSAQRARTSGFNILKHRGDQERPVLSAALEP